MDVFEACGEVNLLLNEGNEHEARNKLIRLLDFLERNQTPYSPLINHLIRSVGLYPYLKPEFAGWQERYIHEAFKVDVGTDAAVTLHREQSAILNKLLAGSNLAVSAPTSFGKSFIVDAYISIARPANVAIIVPTIALTDEIRRRLHQKFARHYKIITTSDVELAERNIFIFPQERAISYVNKIPRLDILIVDEFYKASPQFDKERSSSLLRAILKLGEKASQRYFLAPNISKINDSLFTKGMEFVPIQFNTVYLEKHDLYKKINKDENKKSAALIEILTKNQGKTLIYAGTFSNIETLSVIALDAFPALENRKLAAFEDWLGINYGRNWQLTKLVKRGFGIHNGQLHRSLSQIQVKLFEDGNGLSNLISTSSIIEGVNTSAENVVLWSNLRGGSAYAKINDFTYRNIIGRGGRMFKYFVGKIFILDPPPLDEETQLTLEFPDELVGSVRENEYEQELTREQIAKIISYKEEMVAILGIDAFNRLQSEGLFLSSDSYLLKEIAESIAANRASWHGLVYLNSDRPSDWSDSLYKIIKLQPSGWGTTYTKFVEFVKVLAGNWRLSLPEMLHQLQRHDIGLNKFFELERVATYKLASLLHDVNLLQRELLPYKNIDISPFVAKLAHAFLPPVVHQLEEYGLPRMLAKKLHRDKLLDFSKPDLTIHGCLAELSAISYSTVVEQVKGLHSFDKYILKYFFEGITPRAGH